MSAKWKENFPAVKTGKEKQENYKRILSRFNQAKKSEYYYECLWILYAMLEDRTSAWLFHIGFVSEDDRNRVTKSKAIKPDIRNILNIKPKNRYGFRKLHDKIEKIQKVLTWYESEKPESDYQKALYAAITNIDCDRLKSALKYFDKEWRDKRNELAHALFRKKPECVEEEMIRLVGDGYSNIRTLDQSVSKLKKAKIRATYKIR